jgi:putative DNA primase/helicase
VSLHRLSESRFSLAELYNKLVNIFADLPSKGLKDVSNLKMLTGGDAITAEKKFQHPFSFYNKAKLIFSTNNLPAMPEDGSAMWRRLVIIDFPYQFVGKRDDRHILEKMTTEKELSGLLNLALMNLKELKERGDFTYNKSLSDVRRLYLFRSDPVRVFVEEKCTQLSDTWISKEDLYQAFVGFCKEYRLPALGKNAFGRRMHALDIVSEKQGTWLEHGWVGLKLNNADEGPQPK